MTLASLPYPIPYPDILGEPQGGTISTLATLDAAGEYLAFVFSARENMTISHLGFLTSSVTGSPTADMRVETVGTDGLPSGTLWAANTNAVSATLTNGWNLTALTASASVTQGQMVCGKVAYNSGTSFTVRQAGALRIHSGLPYFVVNTGTPTKTQFGSARGILGVGSSSTTFYPLGRAVMPITAITAVSFNNTNSAKRGVRFQVSFKCRAAGLRLYPSTATGNFNVILENDAGSELSSSSTAFDGDHSPNIAEGVIDVFFDNPVELSPATWYRAVLEPSSATNISLTTVDLPSADYRSGTPWGSNALYTTFASGSYTDTDTDTLPLMDILIDQLDDGAGGGGASKGKLSGLLS